MKNATCCVAIVWLATSAAQASTVSYGIGGAGSNFYSIPPQGSATEFPFGKSFNCQYSDDRFISSAGSVYAECQWNPLSASASTQANFDISTNSKAWEGASITTTIRYYAHSSLGSSGPVMLTVQPSAHATFGASDWGLNSVTYSQFYYALNWDPTEPFYIFAYYEPSQGWNGAPSEATPNLNARTFALADGDYIDIMMQNSLAASSVFGGSSHITNSASYTLTAANGSISSDVPEPASLSLLVCGGLALLRRRRA